MDKYDEMAENVVDEIEGFVSKPLLTERIAATIRAAVEDYRKSIEDEGLSASIRRVERILAYEDAIKTINESEGDVDLAVFKIRARVKEIQ